MNFDATGKRNSLAVFAGAFGQANQAGEAVQTGASYQQVWDMLRATCETVLGPEECRRMLGYQPYLCPPPRETIFSNPLLYVAAGALVGLIIGKVL